jgi:antitoxin component YwqK of YwqJK toxin-antitoxin module
MIVMLLVALSGPLFAQDTCTREALCTEKSTLEEYTYYLDGQGNPVYHGMRTNWRNDGVMSRQREYVDGVEVRSRLWSFDFGTAQPSRYVETDNTTGDRRVTQIDYFSNGCKFSEQQWLNDQKNGITSKWLFSPSCNLLYEQSEYKDDMLHGWHRTWEHDYGWRTEVQYKDGIKHGAENKYYLCTDGSETVFRYTYREGDLHGPATAYPWLSYYEGCIPEGLWSGQYGNGKICGLWSPPGGGAPLDKDSCESLDIADKANPYPEIKADSAVQKEVRGLVVDWDTIAPLADATVVAEGFGSVTTDAKGFYKFTLGTGDTYRISISKTGYHTRTGTFSLAGVQYKRLNAKLKKAGAQPAITNVESQYGGFFLEGIPVQNRYTVAVDWNGAVPGGVKFAVNGVITEVAATGNEVSQSFDMGSAFKAGFGAQTNNLQIVAVTRDGVRSAVERLHPIVVPLPAWSTGLGAFGALEAKDGMITYKLSKAWPAEPIEIQINEKTLGALWSAWNLFPLIGGRNFGIPPTQAYLEVEAKTDGSGSVETGGKSGFEAAGQEIEGKIGGKGNLQYRPGKGLEWKGASLILGIDGTIKKEVGPVTLIPALENAVNLCCGVGSTIKWFNSMAKIEGAIKAGANLDLQIIGSDGALAFDAAEGDLSNGVGLGLSSAVGKLKIQVTGDGTNKAYWQFPANPGYLKKIEAELSAKIAMDLWLFTKEFAESHTFVHPASSASQSLAALSGQSDAFQPVSRAFLDNGQYNQFVPGTNAVRSPMSVSSIQTTLGVETPIVANVYPRSEPAIAVHDGKAALVYVYFDPGKDTLQATDIYFSFDSGDGFQPPAAIKSDTRAEFSPALAFDGQGKVVAVWERVKNGAFVDTGNSEADMAAMAAAMEIVYAVYDPAISQWTDPLALTDNTYLDHSPLLKRAPNGGLMLVWQSNEDNLLIGDAGKPTSVHYTLWDGSAFGATGTLPGTFANCLTFSLAHADSGALLAYTRDMDGNLATTADQEIFYQTFNGSAWGAAVRLTDDAVADVNPQVLYRTDGVPELVWLRDTILVRMTDWTAGSYEIIRAGSESVTFTDFKAAIDPSNRLVLYWQGIDPLGIDIFYSVYDAQSASWSGDLRLTRDPDMERDFQGVFSADGVFHLIYNKQNMTSGAVALYQLNYTLAADAAVFAEGLSIAPANPAPGMETVITARVENRGDVALKNVSVGFYLGDPDAGGVPIGTTPAESALIKAGGSGTASVAWTIPLQADLYRVYARVVTESTVVERDSSNNQAFFDVIKADIEAVQCKVEARGDGSVDITAVIKNSGNIPTGKIDVLYRGDGRDLGVIQLPGLLPGKQAEVSHKVWLDTEFTRWQMTFEVEADPNDTIQELSEANNRASILYFPEAVFPAGHDFKGVAVGASSEARTFTFTNTIAAGIVIGAITVAGPTAAEFKLQNDTCTGQTLASGASCTFAAVFTPTTLGVRTVSFSILSGASADQGSVLAQLVLSGGLAIGKGDVDGNGTIDLTDAVLVLQLLSARATAAVYTDAAAGIDGKIGMKDAIAVLQHLSGLRTLEPPDTSFDDAGH